VVSEPPEDDWSASQTKKKSYYEVRQIFDFCTNHGTVKFAPQNPPNQGLQDKQASGDFENSIFHLDIRERKWRRGFDHVRAWEGTPVRYHKINR
jgi:hypothetical protein